MHAHRGALSHLLSQSGHPKPHEMSALHIPVGGARFRPCLEDVIQFLLEECQFDHEPGWREAVEAGRAAWRQTQARAVVRDFQREAVDVLEDLGYTVKLPLRAFLRREPKPCTPGESPRVVSISRRLAAGAPRCLPMSGRSARPSSLNHHAGDASLWRWDARAAGTPRSAGLTP